MGFYISSVALLYGIRSVVIVGRNNCSIVSSSICGREGGISGNDAIPFSSSVATTASQLKIRFMISSGFSSGVNVQSGIARIKGGRVESSGCWTGIKDDWMLLKVCVEGKEGWTGTAERRILIQFDKHGLRGWVGTPPRESRHYYTGISQMP